MPTTVIRLPDYTDLHTEVDSPEALVAALTQAVRPVRTPRPTPKPRTNPTPRPAPTPPVVERYFRYITDYAETIMPLSLLQERFAQAQAKSPAIKKPRILEWAEQAQIGDRYDGHSTLICISKADAKKGT